MIRSTVVSLGALPAGRSELQLAWVSPFFPTVDRRPSSLVSAALWCCIALTSTLHAQDLQPPETPTPRVQPQLPLASEDAALTPDQILQRRLAEVIRQHEARIDELRGLVDLSTPAPPLDPAMDQIRLERDQAWTSLRTTVDEQIARTRREMKDPLQASKPATQLLVSRPLEQGNRLQIADCYKELASGPDGGVQDLSAGLAVLSAMGEADMPLIDVPRSLYLHVWFGTELARRGPPESKAATIAAAHRAHDDLRRRFPASALSEAAGALFAGLE